MSLQRIEYGCHIGASPEAVYDILIDVESYEEWNPFTPSGSGTPVVGGPLISVKADVGKFGITVKHKIISMEPGRRFVWRDTGFFTRLVCGERSRIMTPSESGGTDYLCSIELTGPMTSLANRLFGPAMNSGVKAEALALKQRAESLT